MSKGTEKESHSAEMENLRSHHGVVQDASPPSYFSVVPSQSQAYPPYNPGSLPTAPYPVMPAVPNQPPYPMPLATMPQPHYGSSMAVGTMDNRITSPAPYEQYPTTCTPIISTNDDTQQIKKKGFFQNKKTLRLRIACVVIGVLFLIGSGTFFLIYQMFDD